MLVFLHNRLNKSGSQRSRFDFNCYVFGVMMIDFNVNNYVHVKLTDIGIAELERQHKKLKETFPELDDFSLPKTDDEGWSKWQMHDLMNRFGHLCTCTMEVPFETSIRIET